MVSPININSLISGIAPQRVGLGQPKGGLAPAGSSRPVAAQEDLFVQGQWWRNYAAGTASDPEGNSLVYKRSASRAQGAGAGETASPAALQGRGPEGSEGKGSGKTAGESQTAETVDPSNTASGELRLTGQETLVLRELQKVDQSVRTHELAHMAAAAGLAKGGPSYSYQRGPDGKNYAVAGEVHIDTSREPTADATVEKMRQVRRAALAPADPSPQDQKVAAQATILMGEAMQEMRLAAAASPAATGQTTAAPVSVYESDVASQRSLARDFGNELLGRSLPNRQHPGIKNYTTGARAGQAANALAGRLVIVV